MSSDYYYMDCENIDMKKKSSLTAKRPAGRIEKGLKKLLVIVLVIFTAQLIWLFGVSPFIPFSTVEVHGFAGIQRAEALSLAGINETSSYITANVNEIRDRLSSHLLVESAVVIKRFPDRLSIFLNPREAAAVTLTNINSRQVPVYVDRNGVFFKIGDSASLENMNLPVLAGIENVRLNMRLPSALVPLVKNLCEMARTSPELLSAISEIRIERKAWDGFDLVVFPVHSSIRVRIENNLTEHTLRYMLVMLNVLEKDINKPNEIDFRSIIGSYQVKEQSL
ncbi:MAG: FtsQ-type POTRA domain-containing protein [Treponema sp.]|nr:FtsQ-type POTRA domain-containing protein [Treponema sp.]